MIAERELLPFTRSFERTEEKGFPEGEPEALASENERTTGLQCEH